MFRQRAPGIYQRTADGRRSVRGRFVASGRANEFRLELGEYRHDLPLTIDPALEFSTYLGGENDDRVTVIGTSYIIGPDRIVLGKDLPTRVSLSTAQTARPPLTLRSSDASRVRFGSNQSGEVTVTGVWEAEIEALADSGEVEITAAAPGFASKTILVKLGPTVVYSGLQPKVVISTWNLPISAYWYFAVWNEDTDTPAGSGWLRRGLEPVSVRWRSSDDDVVKPAQENSTWRVYPVGPGTATVTLECDQFPVKRGQSEIVVNRPGLTVTNAAIGKDLQRTLSIGFETGNSYSIAPRGTVTARSSDPARLLLSAGNGEPGESVTLQATSPYAIAVWAQALASEGEIRVIVSSPEVSEEKEIIVKLDRSVVLPTPASGELKTAVGSSLEVRPMLRPESEATAPVTNAAYSLRPGAPPLRLRISSSNKEVAQPEVTSILFAGDSAFRVRALAPGTSDITLSSDSPDIPARGGFTVSVTQAEPAIHPSAQSLYLGKDLQAAMSARVSAPRDTEVVITTDDPALALVSSNTTSPGQPELRARLTGDEVRFYVEGLKPSGETRVRLKIPGGPEAEIPITLAPSGFAFRSDSVAVPFHSGGGSIELGAYALDDLTGIPLIQEGLRPGVQPELKLRLEGDAIALQSASLTLPASNALAAYTIRDRGESVIFETPPGFTAPSRGARVKVRVVSSVVAAGSPFAAKDALTSADLRVDNSYSRAVDISVESDDPSKLLVASADGPAAAATTVRTPGRLSFHGLADSGTVTVRLRATGVEPVDLAVPLYPVRVTIDGIAEGPVEMLSQSSPSQWRLNLVASIWGVTPRPGSAPVRITLLSSDERVVRIAPTSVEIRSGSTSASVQATGRAPGNAEVQIQAPPGMDVARARIPVSVRAPRLTIPAVALARNLQGAVRIRSEAGALPDNAIVTVTSDSPDRLLLSRSRTGAGSASVAVGFQAGNGSSEPLYLLGLSDSGEATLRLSAEGFADSTARVVLAQPAVVFNTPGTRTMTRGTTETPSLSITPATADQTQYAALEDPSLRLDVVVPIVIQDASVVSAPSEVVFKAGQNPYQNFAVKALAAGRTTITLGVPDGIADPGPRRSTTYQVSLPLLPVSCSEGYVGRDAQLSCSIDVPAGVKVTASSLDPSRVLLSFDARTIGSATVKSAGASEHLYIQGLAADGSAEVVLEASEYLDRSLTIRLSPSTFMLDSGFSGSPIQLNKGAATDLRVTFVRLPTDGSIYTAELRPGVGPFQITLSSSNPGVVRLTPETLTFAAGDRGSKAARLEALAPGTATVRISTPEGFTAPPRTTLLFEVR